MTFDMLLAAQLACSGTLAYGSVILRTNHGCECLLSSPLFKHFKSTHLVLHAELALALRRPA
jgi:hypothetical protein